MNAKTKIVLCVWAFLMFVALEPARAFYDPGTQRWLNRDPIGEQGGLNLYASFANNPITRYDPFGEADKPKNKPKDQPPKKDPPKKNPPKPPKPPQITCPPGADKDCKNLIEVANAKIAKCELEGDGYDTFVDICNCTTPDGDFKEVQVVKCAQKLAAAYQKACP